MYVRHIGLMFHDILHVWIDSKALELLQISLLAVRQTSPGLMPTFKPWNTPEYAKLT